MATHIVEGDGVAVAARVGRPQAIARLLMMIAGAAAMAWSVSVLPAFWTESDIISVSKAILDGEAFKPEVLASVDAQTTGANNASKLRSSLLVNAVAVRLRRAEDALHTGNQKEIERSFESLRQVLDQALLNAPNEPFLWLIQYWFASTRTGLRPESFNALRMSYGLGKYEGWIAIKRNRLAMEAFSVLPKDLSELAIAEFVGLVRWGLIFEAAEIAAGRNQAIRAILFDRLKELNIEQRRAFARRLYQRDLDDVPVPGVEPPPAARVPMPILPSGF